MRCASDIDRDKYNPRFPYHSYEPLPCLYFHTDPDYSSTLLIWIEHYGGECSISESMSSAAWSALSPTHRLRLCQWSAAPFRSNYEIYPRNTDDSFDFENTPHGTLSTGYLPTREENRARAEWVFLGFLLIREIYIQLKPYLKQRPGFDCDNVEIVWAVPVFMDPEEEGWVPEFWLPLEGPYVTQYEIIDDTPLRESRMFRVIQAHFPEVTETVSYAVSIGQHPQTREPTTLALRPIHAVEQPRPSQPSNLVSEEDIHELSTSDNATALRELSKRGEEKRRTDFNAKLTSLPQKLPDTEYANNGLEWVLYDETTPGSPSLTDVNKLLQMTQSWIRPYGSPNERGSRYGEISGNEIWKTETDTCHPIASVPSSDDPKRQSLFQICRPSVKDRSRIKVYPSYEKLPLNIGSEFLVPVFHTMLDTLLRPEKTSMGQLPYIRKNIGGIMRLRVKEGGPIKDLSDDYKENGLWLFDFVISGGEDKS
ncbi:hypothetical protein BJ508DRAFT_381774 [Ascobolus immersus RN42]|uniref:Uncharacterized protein n=1 Tax=Ascobolus immersus RN42 TaxID=1160509 RepID=A0A3N4HCG9_ASCIM|nr:hypothetical protein BJ508DRAFT_381774 [Ascobolus immersus RN42]